MILPIKLPQCFLVAQPRGGFVAQPRGGFVVEAAKMALQEKTMAVLIVAPKRLTASLQTARK